MGSIVQSAIRSLERTSGYHLYLDHGVLFAQILTTELVRGPAMQEIVQSIAEKMHQASTAVVVDCTKLTGQVSAGFLGSLMGLRKRATKRKLLLCICGASPTLREVFEIVHFQHHIPIYSTAAEAVFRLGNYDELESVRLNFLQFATEEDEPPRTLLRRRKVWAAAVAMLGVCLTGGLARHYSAASTRTDTVTPLAALTSVLKGRITAMRQTVAIDDEGAYVVAWRTTAAAVPKFTSREVAECVDDAQSTQRGLYAACAGAGRYWLSLPQGEFQVLMISGNAVRESPINPADLATLSRYFSDPAKLLGNREYSLTKCVVPEHSTLTLDRLFDSSQSKIRK